MKKISIVIPTWNSQDTIAECLSSIYAQECIDFCEVIVVDDCSTDATLDIIEKFPCKIVRLTKHSGAAVARNEGVKQSTGDIVLFLDSDVLLQNGMIRYIIHRFEENPEVDVIQGVYTKYPAKENLSSLARNYYKCHKIQKLANNEYICGINSYCFAIKKDVFKKIGGFNPYAEGVEDVELGYRLTKEGYKILLDKNFQVQHMKNWTFFGLLKSDYHKVLSKTKLFLNICFQKVEGAKVKTGITFSLNKAANMISELLSIPLSLLIFINILMLILFNKIALVYSFLGLVCLFYLLNIKFFNFIRRDKGILTALGCFLVYYFEMLVSQIATLSGIYNYFRKGICKQTDSVLEKIRWGKKILFHKNIFPEQVTLFVTNRCNLRCKHCFYWQSLNRKDNEFTIEEIEKVSKSMGRFSFLSLGGGEPFLRDDIADIVNLFITENKVSRISIPTNGFLTERIVELTEKILKVSNAKGKTKIIVKVSFDGINQQHDKIRGVKGSFENAVKTFLHLKELKHRYTNLRLGVLLTLSRLNEYSLWDTYKWIKENLCPDVVGLNFVRGNIQDETIKEVDLDNYLRLYSHILQDYNGFYSVYKSKVSEFIAEIVRTKKYPLKCYAGSISVVIDSLLNVFPCENLGQKIGNLRDYEYNFKKLWFSENALRIREYLENSGCCCTCECNLQMNSFFNIQQLFDLVKKTIRCELGLFQKNLCMENKQ